LRKGREDNRDVPGAADFYYGEMEMRRASAGESQLAERIVLWLYWLVSGYGLRTTRALAALLLVLFGTSVLFYQFGFVAHESFSTALLLSAREATALGGNDRLQLTIVGSVLEIGLRLLGPLLLGLALLSLRGRITR